MTVFGWIYVGPSMGAGLLVPGEVRFLAVDAEGDPAWVRLDGRRLQAEENEDLAVLVPEWCDGEEIRLPRVVLPVES